MGKLDGKVALVTGSGRGYGRPIALTYAKEGAKVVSIARPEREDRSELESLAEIISAQGGEVLTITIDLSSGKEIQQMKNEVLDTYGGLDILVNNAAFSTWKPFTETTIKDWDFTMAVNLRAPFILTKVFFETLKNRGGGSIINITSRSAEEGFMAAVAYGPSKYGLEGLTQCLALELKPYNIAVNLIGVGTPPGKIMKPTSLTLDQMKKMPKEIRDQYPDDESMVEAFGDAWVFLAALGRSAITGQRFQVHELADFLKQNGWEAAIAKWRGKLTRAVYTPYDFPKKIQYLTPDFTFKEREFK